MMKIEPGQTVFVVHQRSRAAERSGAEVKTEERTVERVGRKYAYLAARFDPEPFCLETGASHHPRDSNVRANGFGFDVFESRAAWETKIHADEEYTRLRKRLVAAHGSGLKPLTSETVEAIHRILDDEERR